MKTFNKLRNNENILEESLLRKGSGLLFANKASRHGQRAEQHFKKSISYLEVNTTNKSPEDLLPKLMLALGELGNGLIEVRKQNGANTSLALISILLSEKSKK